MDVLPPELMLEIFQFCRPQHTVEDAQHMAHETFYNWLNNLSRVSRLWRDILLAAPMLWTDIYLTMEHMSVPTTFLHQSQKLPLNVVGFIDDEPDWKTSTSSNSRPDADTDTERKDFKSLDLPREVATLLSTITRIAESRAIHYLHLHICIDDSIEDRPSQWQPILTGVWHPDFRHLKTLRLTSHYSEIADYTFDKFIPDGVALPSLTRLSFLGVDNSCVLRLLTPTVENLSINDGGDETDYNDCPEIVEEMATLVHLETLHLNNPHPAWSADSSGGLTAVLPALRQLFVHFPFEGVRQIANLFHHFTIAPSFISLDLSRGPGRYADGPNGLQDPDNIVHLGPLLSSTLSLPSMPTTHTLAIELCDGKSLDRSEEYLELSGWSEAPEALHEDGATLELSLTHYPLPLVLQHVVGALPLQDVKALTVAFPGHSNLDPIPPSTWYAALRHMRTVTKLKLTGDSSHAFLYALLLFSTQLLPELQELDVRDVDFALEAPYAPGIPWINLLIEVLRDRTRANRRIRTLYLSRARRCNSFQLGLAFGQCDFVGAILWDHVESFS